MREIKKLYVGIDIAKDKFDVMYTIDGQNYFGMLLFVIFEHKKKSQMALGIKNSWKYEKDLIIIFNSK